MYRRNPSRINELGSLVDALESAINDGATDVRTLMYLITTSQMVTHYMGTEANNPAAKPLLAKADMMIVRANKHLTAALSNMDNYDDWG